MDFAALQGIAARRSQTYWLLSRLFIERPERPLLDEVATALHGAADADTALTAELAALASALRGVPVTDDGLLAMQVEFTRLLGGLDKDDGGPPPFESVARESLLLGDATLAVDAFYREAGYTAIAPAAGPPDHLGTELRFLALVCYREMEAWAASDAGPARQWLDRERRFLDAHVLRWVPRYCADMAARARHGFYRSTATLTARLCTADREDIDALLDASS